MDRSSIFDRSKITDHSGSKEDEDGRGMLFHHAQGQTTGFHAFADELRQAGHTVHTPDLFDGRTFDSIDEGMAYVGQIGFGEIIDRGVACGKRTARRARLRRFLARRRTGTEAGADPRRAPEGRCSSTPASPMSEFGAWPADVPVQIHGMDADPFFVGRGRHRRRPRARRVGRGRRAVPLSRRSALLRRLQPAVLRRERDDAAHAARARLPRPR